MTTSLSSDILLNIGLLLVLGFSLGRLSQAIKLPEVTGYLLAGLILGELNSKFTEHDLLQALTSISEIALALIALNLGSDLYFPTIKKIENKIILITLLQTIITFCLVMIPFYLIGFHPALAALLAAIASASAPAAIISLTHELKIHNKFIDYLLGTIALSDALSIIVFGIVFSFVQNSLGATPDNFSLAYSLFYSLGKIFFSLAIGSTIGFLTFIATKHWCSPENILDISIGLIFILVGLAMYLNFSSLLASISAGATLINLTGNNHKIFKIIDHLTPPIYLLFFVTAGLELKLDLLTNLELLSLGSTFVILRNLGKYLGTYLGSNLAHIKKFWATRLGLCMFPHAGLAIGFILLLQQTHFSEALDSTLQSQLQQITKIILFSVLINEIIGPILAKKAIEESKNHHRKKTLTKAEPQPTV